MLVLIRGLPGSGKSSIANALKEEEPRSKLIEADQFFVTGGEYHFDPKDLATAHSVAQNTARDAMKSGTPVVAVSNTFTQKWEMVPYIQMAKDNNYRVYVIDLFDGKLSDKQLAELNGHGVGETAIASMRKRYEKTPTGSWSAKQVNEFLTANSESVFTDGYVGLTIDYGLVMGKSELLAHSLRLAKDVNEFWTMCDNRLKRNISKRDVYRGDSSRAFHLTLVSPDEWRSARDKDGLLRAMKTIAASSFNLDGVGSASRGNDLAIYMTVSGTLVDQVKSIRKSHGLTGEWYPHVTIAIRGNDVHGVPKTANLPMVRMVPPSGAVYFVECCMHPAIIGNPGAGLIDFAAMKAGGPDDNTYLRYPELNTMLPRGLVFVSDSGNAWNTRCVFRGLPKFTGTLGNDEEIELSDTESEKMVTGVLTGAVDFVISKKENGRGGGISIVDDLGNNKYVVCVGTKLRHELWNYDMGRNVFTKIRSGGSGLIAANVIALGNSMGESNRSEIVKLLLKPGGTTLNCEINDFMDQHIERVPDGVQEAVGLAIITEGNVQMKDGIAILSRLRWPTPPQTGPFPVKDLQKHLNLAKSGRTEGYVFYFRDAKRDITGLLKVKTAWYIGTRATREFVSNNVQQRAPCMSKDKMPQYLDSLKTQLLGSQWTKSKFTYMQDNLGSDYRKVRDAIVANAITFSQWYAVAVQQRDPGATVFRPMYPKIWDDWVLWEKRQNPRFTDDVMTGQQAPQRSGYEWMRLAGTINTGIAAKEAEETRKYVNAIGLGSAYEQPVCRGFRRQGRR